MEIEKKFLVDISNINLSDYKYHIIEQAYLNTSPVIRIRREDDNYYLTYKGGGMMVREEYNLPLNEESYYHLLPKADGNVISKTRYLIPFNNHTIELDVFKEPFEDILLAEVEFDSEEDAINFTPPEWFTTEVTFDKRYHNSYLSKLKL